MTKQIDHSAPQSPSRRDMLKVGLGAGGALFVAFGIPTLAKRFQQDGQLPGVITEAKADVAPFAPNAFIRIEKSGDITFIVPQAEMGQGVYTSMSMLIAEELEVDLNQIKVEAAPASNKLYTNPALGEQVTGGSTSVRGFYKPLRVAGATTREVLIGAAAKTWNVDPSSCRAEKGVVIHGASGRKARYGELIEAAASIPVPADVKLKDPKDFKLIGTPAKRVDMVDKTNGRATFGIDIRLPGMKIATVAASPVIGGKLKSVDDSKAKAVKGVRQIVKLDDAVAVVADQMGAAKRGLDALKIEWDEGDNGRVSNATMVADLEQASNNAGVVARNEGNVDTAFAGAAKTLEAVYQLPFLAHATMEPMNTTVHVKKDSCDIWVGTQVQARAQKTAADVTGLPLEKVVIHNQYLGGGFGRRLEVESITQAVQIAKQVDGPVKVVWTREEDIQHDIYRPYYYDVMRAGLDASGKPTAFQHRVTGSSIVARWLPPWFQNGLDPDAVEGAAGPYNFANVHIDYVRQEPPKGLTTTWWRGVGVTHNAFMVESFLDEMATAASQDPVEYRRVLLDKEPRAKAVLDLVAEKAGWSKPLPKGVGRGVALIFGFGTYMAQVAEVAVAPDGNVKVQRVVCAVDTGVVINPNTVEAQIQSGIIYGLTAALYGEITFKNGRVEQSNFDNYQIVRINEAPVIEVHIVKSSEAPGGIGEPGTSALAPAVANAIFAATGKRLRKMPIDIRELKAV
jgi:isoquinoline 1-oxidoreductase beta subunit